MTPVTSQAIDQTAKGSLAALINYVLVKVGMDPQLIVIVFPSIMVLLSWISTKIGDPTIASFLGFPVAQGDTEAASSE